MAQKKILLIDDDLDFVAGTQAFLEGHGYQIVAAYDGDEGQKKAEEEKPDLIILDVMMRTDTEGFEVARSLRANEATKQIPIIMLTGVNQYVPWRFGPDKVWLPVDAFIDKPMNPQQLLAAVKTAMAQTAQDG